MKTVFDRKLLEEARFFFKVLCQHFDSHRDFGSTIPAEVAQNWTTVLRSSIKQRHFAHHVQCRPHHYDLISTIYTSFKHLRIKRLEATSLCSASVKFEMSLSYERASCFTIIAKIKVYVIIRFDAQISWPKVYVIRKLWFIFQSNKYYLLYSIGLSRYWKTFCKQ